MRCPKCSSENVQVHYETEKKGFSGGQGCCGWLIFGPIGVLCGLCGKDKVKSEEKYWVCNNCGARFTDYEAQISRPVIDDAPSPKSNDISNSISDNMSDSEEVKTSQKLFDLSYCEDFNSDAVMNCLKVAFGFINDNKTIEDYFPTLDNLAKEHSEWATQNVNTELMQTVKDNVIKYLDSDEDLIFYKDGGIIAKGKTGTLITTKKIISFNKGTVNTINISDIYLLHFSSVFANSCIWYFNANIKIQIDSMACTPEEQGVIIALICTMIYNCHSGNCKLKLLNGSLL